MRAHVCSHSGMQLRGGSCLLSSSLHHVSTLHISGFSSRLSILLLPVPSSAAFLFFDLHLGSRLDWTLALQPPPPVSLEEVSSGLLMCVLVFCGIVDWTEVAFPWKPEVLDRCLVTLVRCIILFGQYNLPDFPGYKLSFSYWFGWSCD